MQCLYSTFCSKCKTSITKILQERLHLSADSRRVLLEDLNIFKDLGLSKDAIEKFAKKVGKKDPNKLKKTVELIKSLGFSNDDIVAYPKILKHNRSVIDNRFKVLEEGGVCLGKITIPTMLHFPKIGSTSVSQLKKRGLVDEQTNITQHILSYCDLPRNLYPLELEESCTFKECQVIANQTYLSWEFNLSLQEIQKVYKTYLSFSLKSLRLILESYTFLTTNFGLSKELITQNMYLLIQHPTQYKEFLEQFSLIGIQPVREVVKRYPKLVTRPVGKVLETLDILKEFKISSKSLNLYADILTLSPQTVRKRLQFLHSDYNFQPFFHHPRICKVVTSFNNVTKRFKQLSDTKWRTKTLDMLSVHSAIFQGRLKLGADVSKGNDTVHYLHKELKLKRSKVRDLLKQNPFWCCVSVGTVTCTLKLLRETGFDSSHICAALPITLYPKDDVNKWLKLVDSQPEVDCCRDPVTGKIQPDLILPLVLYFLERPFHFTGNGIWDTQADQLPDNSPDHTSLIDPVL